MGRRVQTLSLSEEEKRQLRAWIISEEIDSKLIQRAWIILLASESRSLEAISQEVGLSFPTCSYWKQRFKKMGLEGLKDQPRAGSPKKISAEKEAEVLELACSIAPGELGRWSQTKLAQKTGLSQSSIHRILIKANLKLSHDTMDDIELSEFKMKQAAILGLFLNLPENILIVSIEEPYAFGSSISLSANQKMMQSKYLTDVTSYREDTSILSSFQTQSNRPIDSSNLSFSEILKAYGKRYPGKTLHIIVGNMTREQYEQMKIGMEKSDKVIIHFISAYSAWLNHAEMLFTFFLSEAIHSSREILISRIIQYLRHYNEHRHKVFRWSYSNNFLMK